MQLQQIKVSVLIFHIRNYTDDQSIIFFDARNCADEDQPQEGLLDEARTSN